MSLTPHLRNHLVEPTGKPSMAEVYGRSRRRDWGVDRSTIVSAVRDLREHGGADRVSSPTRT